MNAYLDLLVTEKEMGEIDKIQIFELMSDIKIQKKEFKEHIKNPKEIAIIKKELIQVS